MNEEGRRKSPGVIDSRSDPQAVVANTWVTPSSLMADMENNHTTVPLSVVSSPECPDVGSVVDLPRGHRVRSPMPGDNEN